MEKLNRKIILVSGKQRSGKDTFAKVAATRGFKISSFALTIKKQVSEALKISLEELEHLKNTTAQYRNLLISWAEMRKTTDKAYFVREALKTDGNLVIPDFRFYEELDAVHKDTKTIIYTVRVNCPEEIRQSRGKITNQTDRSELELDTFVADFTIENTGTVEEFYLKCDEVLNKIGV